MEEPQVNFIKPDKVSFILFLLPILTLWTISVGGELMLSDIAVTVLAVIILFDGRAKLNQPYLKSIFSMMALWLVGSVISDIVNETTALNIIKGSAAIIFFGLHLFVLFVLVNGSKERLFWVMLGLAFRPIMGWLIGVSNYSEQPIYMTPWRMGVGFGLTLSVALLASVLSKGTRKAGVFVTLTSPLHLLFNARSIFLISALAGAVSIIQFRLYNAKQRIIALTFFLVLGIFALPVGTYFYDYLNKQGIFGEEARAKYLLQTAHGEIPILLAGRSEILISSRAVADSPFVGHGSWANDPKYFFQYKYLQERLGKDGAVIDVDLTEYYRIPTHSILMQAWVENGLLGAFFWLYILIIAIRSVGCSLSSGGLVTTAEMLIIIALIWDLFFSPFGQARRCLTAIFIVVAVLNLRKYKALKTVKS